MQALDTRAPTARHSRYVMLRRFYYLLSGSTWEVLSKRKHYDYG